MSPTSNLIRRPEAIACAYVSMSSSDPLHPRRWKRDLISSSIYRRVSALATRRLKYARKRAWQDAFSRTGTGSTFVRARIIASDVYEKGAPVPTTSPTREQNRFLREVTELVEEAAEEVGVRLK